MYMPTQTLRLFASRAVLQLTAHIGDFVMTRHLILAQSRTTAAALEAWLPLLIPNIGPVATGVAQNVESIVWGDPVQGDEAGVRVYNYLVNQIENTARLDDEASSPRQMVILVDALRPLEMNAVAENCGWSHLIGLLILTFPEIRWIFGLVHDAGSDFPVREHSLAALVKGAWRDPLLDPSGLRNWIRQHTNEILNRGNSGFEVPGRKFRAASIDDERDYCYFHGYVAYRFGYRTDVVDSWALMAQLFSSESSWYHHQEGGHGYRILLEDMSLNFPDKPAEKHIFYLHKRAESLDLLDSLNEHSESAAVRLLITSGYDHDNRLALISNQKFLALKKTGAGKVILKPLGGILDLWSQAGQMHAERSGQRAGNAPEFEWPLSLSVDGELAGHGAPGKLVLVAETLIRRAEVLRTKAGTIRDFVVGAVFTTDAAELMGGRTPMLTLLSLTLKHEFETRAECGFVGAGYHFDVRSRTDEIELESEAVCSAFVAPARRLSALNAQSVILNRLAMVFREQGNFEEESECMVALRKRNRWLRLQRSGGASQWIPSGILWYAELLLASFGRLIAGISLWLFALTIVWFLLDRGHGWKSAFSGAWSAFFGGNAASDTASWAVMAWSGVALVSGMLHLGVLISYIYSLISRK
jgi:hypothetical protein